MLRSHNKLEKDEFLGSFFVADGYGRKAVRQPDDFADPSTVSAFPEKPFNRKPKRYATSTHHNINRNFTCLANMNSSLAVTIPVCSTKP